MTSLVDAPDAVKIDRVEDGDDIILEVTVDPDDIGKVVGKQGRIIKAIRTLARAASGSGRDRRSTSRSSARERRMNAGTFVPMGRVARLHGLKGEVVVHTLDGVPFLVSEGMRVWFVPPPRRHPRGDRRRCARGARGARSSGSPR